MALEQGVFETDHEWSCLSLGFQDQESPERVTVRISTHAEGRSGT